MWWENAAVGACSGRSPCLRAHGEGHTALPSQHLSSARQKKGLQLSLRMQRAALAGNARFN